MTKFRGLPALFILLLILFASLGCGSGAGETATPVASNNGLSPQKAALLDLASSETRWAVREPWSMSLAIPKGSKPVADRISAATPPLTPTTSVCPLKKVT